MIFEKVIGDNIKQRCENAEDGYWVNNKTTTAHQQPAVAVIYIGVFSTGCTYVAEQAEQCTNESSDNKKMTELPRP